MADTNITMTTAGGVRLETEGTYVDTDIVVAPDSTSQENLIPENIRSGVSILDVEGTLNPQDGLSMYTTTATLATTGTGTIAATAINLPTGRTLQVDDLLVDTAGTVCRVTAVGTNVSYTYYASYRGPAGTNGTNGTDGTDGKNGLSIYPTTTALSSSGGSIAASNITLPEFRSIQTYDLLLGTNGVVGQVTSAGSTVRYTAFTDIHGENGEDGAPGKPGANGRPALTCNGFNIDTSGEAPEVGQSYTKGMAALNQTPVIGEKFLTVINTATDIYPDGGSYLCGCIVMAVNGDLGTIGATFTFSIQTVNSITGQRGPAGQGVPSGGTTGQVLKKASNTAYDTVWADESGGGSVTTIELHDSRSESQIYTTELTNISDDDIAVLNTILPQWYEANKNKPEYEALNTLRVVFPKEYTGWTDYSLSGMLTNFTQWDGPAETESAYDFELEFVIADKMTASGELRPPLIVTISYYNSSAHGNYQGMSYYLMNAELSGTPKAPTPTSSSDNLQIANKKYVDDNAGIKSDTASQSAFSTVSNIVTTTADSPDASGLPEGTLVIKIAS